MLNVALETRVDAFHLDVAFGVESGRTAVLLGESGAGKSTILRLLAGLQQPQRGLMVLDGITYYDSESRIFIPPQRRPFGYVFQDYVLFPHLTVFENVAFGLRAQHLSRSLIRSSVADALEMVQLAHLAQRLPAQLSGGQQQRVAIARALALRPRLMLLDEPLAALDVQTRREVRQELRKILREVQITTLFVTHHYLDGLLFGDQLLVIDQGRLVQQGDQRELRDAPRSSYIAELVGINFFRGRVIHTENETTCLIRLHSESSTVQPIEVVAMLKEQVIQPADGTEIFVVIDPRSITLHQSQPEGSARNVFQGTIMHVIPLSASTGSNEGKVRVSIALNQSDAPLMAEITENSATRMGLQEGQTVFATFKASEASAYL
ncbi:ABC transporter ATP-binding protein [Dictyobacter aurantiacus]|uniref:ABC transporter ATP-binding protein n=1 Tax=Dictyobacter aurantiacus TaxID=1936993 RepID=A0A401ZED4_9CHLR|nr:ABC transporter ATP-binding protein [Dictyobacter aurantiacus]GCE05206.1 ABC transporter ATP-binding protein [Dictyobacter aurantiacus]